MTINSNNNMHSVCTRHLKQGIIFSVLIMHSEVRYADWFHFTDKKSKAQKSKQL